MKIFDWISSNLATVPEAYSEPNQISTRWNFLRKQFTAEICSLFSQKVPS